MSSPTATNFVPDQTTLRIVFPKDLSVQIIAVAVKLLAVESAPLTVTDMLAEAKV
jgi:hypothetical protein